MTKSSMRAVVVAVLTVVLGAAGALWTEEAGAIRVICAPGVKVFLDGKKADPSSEGEGGWLLEGVPPGDHVVRLVVSEAEAKEIKVRVAAGATALVKLGGRVSTPRQEGQAGGEDAKPVTTRRKAGRARPRAAQRTDAGRETAADSESTQGAAEGGLRRSRAARS